MTDIKGPAPAPTPADEMRTGFLFALLAYGMWGFIPLFYKLTEHMDAIHVVGHRIVWSVVCVGLFLLVVGRMREVREILGQPKQLVLLFLSASAIALNWLIFIWAVAQAKVLDVSLGYFINPLVSILIGLLVLREKLNRLQMLAVALVGVAVAVQGIMAGGLPWISLVLALSFAAYGYLRKITPVKATPGLFVETLLLVPFALAWLLWNWQPAVADVATNDLWLFGVLISSGVVTALPLICFSAGARRLPMIYIGLMQYIAPSFHFLLAVFLLHEPLDQARLTTFSVVWLALLIFTYDSLKRARRNRITGTP